MPYFRIRKVFNPEIIRSEAEKQIMIMELDNSRNTEAKDGISRLKTTVSTS